MIQNSANFLPNILQISTSDTKGGAPLAAYNLHSTLRNLGFNSNLWVSEKTTEDESVKLVSNDWVNYLIRRIRWRRLPIKFVRYWFSRPKGYTLFSDHRARKTENYVWQIRNFNIINLHWISQFIDYYQFFRFVQGTQPVVWTMHDMNPFTGGCHINPDCNYFQSNCGRCPQLGSNDAKDISRQIWYAKYDIFSHLHQEQLRLVAPSSWMKKQIQVSSLMGRFRTTIIPNGINNKLFSPQNSVYCRETLGIPKDKFVILFVANALTVEHKGLHYLLKALYSSVPINDKILVLVGKGKPVIAHPITHIHLNYLNSKQLPMAYSAADILAMPSLQESFGLTAVESLACGTPVVGFDVGGISDMVRPGVTGLLVPPKDVNALGKAIQSLLINDALREMMSKNCRRIAVEEYSIEVQAKRYFDLYQEMLSHEMEAQP